MSSVHVLQPKSFIKYPGLMALKCCTHLAQYDWNLLTMKKRSISPWHKYTSSFYYSLVIQVVQTVTILLLLFVLLAANIITSCCFLNPAFYFYHVFICSRSCLQKRTWSFTLQSWLWPWTIYTVWGSSTGTSNLKSKSHKGSLLYRFICTILFV